jgi:mono/diheme cytochrome c family protein
MRRHRALLVPLLALVLASCSRPGPPKAIVVNKEAPQIPETKDDPLAYTNGLTNAERAEFYHVAEGSEVYPLDWLKVLRNKETGKPFLEDLERVGFLPDPTNEDKLPVGLTAEPARGLEPMGKMVGINCAACHVGQLSYKGQAMRIDGAPNLADTHTFFKDLIVSALATAEDPEQLVAFLGRLHTLQRPLAPQDTIAAKLRQAEQKLLSRLLVTEAEALKKALMPVVKSLLEMEKAQLTADLTPPAQAGADNIRQRLLGNFKADAFKGRVDDGLLQEVLDHLPSAAEREMGVLHTVEEIYISVRFLKARAEYLTRLGIIGKDQKTEWGPGRVDAFGSARAFLFEKAYLPEAAVSYPYLWNFERVPWLHYDGNTTSVMERNMGQALGVGAVTDDSSRSSLRPVNLDRLEQLAGKITPPRWPEQLLGKIDQDKVKRGAVHFKEHCANCHIAFEPGKDARDLLFDVKTVGTDPKRAETFAQKLTEGPFKGKFFFEAIHDTMAKIRDRSYEDNQITPAQQKAFAKGRPNDWRGTGKYAARPLVAIWATAPYLHNGSVPTLDDLLKPAKDRPPTFYVGSREYDPEKLGYVTHMPGQKDNFDTSTVGNRNIGHEYGTDLTIEQRQELLEYLKAN